MKNYPIDVQIYVSNIMNALETLVPGICLEEEINDESKFVELLEESIIIKATENMIEFDEPILDEGQINNILTECVVRYHLDEMVELGLIKANLDVETGENVYSLGNA